MGTFKVGMNCVHCSAELVSVDEWRALSPAEREGKRPVGNRGLCDPDYNFAHRWGMLDGFERLDTPAAIVAEEWSRLADRQLSQNENVRRLAPRLGMTPSALAQAILRLKRRGELEWRSVA